MPLLDLFRLNLQYFSADGGGGSGEGGGEPNDPPNDPPTEPNNPSDPGGQGDGEEGQTFDVSYVKELRGENAKRRTENKQLKEQLTAIQKALGLDGDEPDADELQTQLQTTQQQLKSLKVENAFGRVASNLGADAELTLAVLKANGKLDELDIESESFSNDLESLVKETLENNPKLKATAPQKTGTVPPNNQGGSGAMDMNTLIRRAAGR